MAGYRLHQSSRLASFPETRPDLFLSDDPLAPPVYTVVQNAGLGEWLMRKLAAIRGAVMAPSILLPEQALRQFALGYPAAAPFRAPTNGERAEKGNEGGRGLLFMDGMKLVLFKALEESLAGDDPAFDPVRAYAGDGEERLWQLCDALSGLFYSYGMNCPPLVRHWEAGAAYPAAAAVDRAAEAWQRELWRRVFRPDSPYAHLSGLLAAIMDSGESYEGCGGRIVLFGSMFLGETGLRFFRYLADDFDVDHFILSPSKAWSAGVEARTPFLEANGGLSRGFGSLVPSLNPDETTAGWDNPGNPARLLHRLRASFIEDSPLAGPTEPDGSLAFHDVIGLRRAVEVLKDRILEALRDDPSLAPTQIGVLAPDIARYAPFIEAIFPSRSGHDSADRLPYNIADLPAGTEAPYPSAFRALSALPGSPFGRRAVLDLLDNPCFVPAARNPDLVEDWRRMIADLNVRWGLDAAHRKENGAVDTRTGSWRTAFDRLLAGYWHDEGDDPRLLPAYLAGDGDAEAAGALMRVLGDLERDFRDLENQRLPLREWCLLWESLVERWIVPRNGEGREGDEADRLAAKKSFRDLMALCDDVDDLSDFADGRLPWTAFSSLMGETAASASRRRGRYLASGVSCASLKPMRAIPFRRIYVLGLDEGAWPNAERTPGFDFRDRVPKAIDLSRESVDRFALLETIFSAEEHLSLFYAGRDAERGENLAPASPVLELLEHLGHGAADLIVKHPLNPFDAMTGSGPAASSSREALELARARSGGLVLVDPAPSRLPMDAEEIVDWHDLAVFLKNPVEYFFRRRLGTSSLEGEDDDRRDDDRLEADSLEWWKWRSAAVSGDPAALTRPGDFVKSFRERLSAEGAVAESAASDLQAELWRADAEALAAQLDRLIREGLDVGETFACRLESVSPGVGLSSEGTVRVAAAPTVSPAGAPPATVTGLVDGLRLLNGPDGSDESVWTLLEFVSSKKLRAGHSLVSWTKAVVLGAALGESRPREIRVFRLGSRDFAARRYYFDPRDIPAGTGGERILLESPAALLRSLIRVYRDGTAEPLSLFPELADGLVKAGMSAPPGAGAPSDDDLSQAALAAWNAVVSDDRTLFSTLRDCPWRRRFLKNPDFRSEAFRRAWEEVYLRGIVS